MSWQQFRKHLEREVPDILLRKKEQVPFDTCSDCKGLLDKGHCIFKSFSRWNLEEAPNQVIEIALCQNCLTHLGSHISEKTSENLEKLREKYPRLDPSNHLADSSEESLACAITGKSIHELKEYHLNGLIIDNKLIGRINVIGDEGLTEYENCLSAETKGLEDDLINRILDLPPEIEDLLKDRNPILL